MVRNSLQTIGYGNKAEWMEKFSQTVVSSPIEFWQQARVDGEFMQDWYFSLHPFSDVLKFDGVFSLKIHNRSIDSIRISERMVFTPGHSTAFGSNPALD